MARGRYKQTVPVTKKVVGEAWSKVHLKDKRAAVDVVSVMEPQKYTSRRTRGAQLSARFGPLRARCRCRGRGR